MNKYYETILNLTEIAGSYNENVYNVLPTALGFIPFKNQSNMSNEVGTGFIEVCKWLLDEAEKNFNEGRG